MFDWLCYLDIQSGGTKLVHVRICPGIGQPLPTLCVEGAGCAKKYAADSLRKGYVSKLRMALKDILFRGEDWDPALRRGNPCGSRRVDYYLTFVTETQLQPGVSVNQAVPLLSHTLVTLLESMRVRAAMAGGATEGITTTRDVALSALAFASLRRGFDISNTLGSQVLRLPDFTGIIINFRKTAGIGGSGGGTDGPGQPKNLRCPGCEHVYRRSFTSGLGPQWWSFVPGCASGRWAEECALAAQMTSALQSHCRAASLPDHFTMHSFRVGGCLSKPLAGMAVDEIMKLGGWKTQTMAEHYIGPTFRGADVGEGGT